MGQIELLLSDLFVESLYIFLKRFHDLGHALLVATEDFDCVLTEVLIHADVAHLVSLPILWILRILPVVIEVLRAGGLPAILAVFFSVEPPDFVSADRAVFSHYPLFIKLFAAEVLENVDLGFAAFHKHHLVGRNWLDRLPHHLELVVVSVHLLVVYSRVIILSGRAPFVRPLRVMPLFPLHPHALVVSTTFVAALVISVQFLFLLLFQFVEGVVH